MTVKYWVKNLFYGFIFFVISIMVLKDNPRTNANAILSFIAFVNFFLFPFAKYVIESIALKYTDREFWVTGMFMEIPAKSGIYAAYYLFIFIFSIPVGMFYLIYVFLMKNGDMQYSHTLIVWRNNNASYKNP